MGRKSGWMVTTAGRPAVRKREPTEGHPLISGTDSPSATGPFWSGWPDLNRRPLDPQSLLTFAAGILDSPPLVNVPGQSRCELSGVVWVPREFATPWLPRVTS
jgi:hypothetical protein